MLGWIAEWIDALITWVVTLFNRLYEWLAGFVAWLLDLAIQGVMAVLVWLWRLVVFFWNEVVWPLVKALMEGAGLDLDKLAGDVAAYGDDLVGLLSLADHYLPMREVINIFVVGFAIVIAIRVARWMIGLIPGVDA